MFTPDQAKGLSMVYLQSLGNEVPTRELMWHIVRSEKWFGESVAAGNFDADGSDGPAFATAAEILAHYDRHVPPVSKRIATLSGDQLAAREFLQRI
jgi:hypothetical protein